MLWLWSWQIIDPEIDAHITGGTQAFLRLEMPGGHLQG